MLRTLRVPFLAMGLAVGLALPVRAEPGVGPASAPRPSGPGCTTANGCPVERAVPTEASRRAALERELDRLAAWVERQKGELTAQIVDIETRRVLAEKNPTLSLNPASNAKVPTAAAVLAQLGPDFRFTTGLYGVVRDGRVERLVLRSNGDPSLSTTDLEALVKALVDAGVTRVGEVLVDQSAFDSRFVPPAFEQQPEEWAPFRAPVSAVSVNGNAFVVSVEPAEPGQPARVTVDPAGYVEVEGKVLTERRGKGRKIAVEMRPGGAALTVRLTGHIAVDAKPTSFARRVDDPRLYAGYVLRALLQRRGIVVEGGVAEGGKSERNPLAQKRSEPLAVLVRQVGKASDNFYAETLLKVLGAETTGRAGTSADGAAAVRAWLESVGAADGGTKLTNGSGLFDANRLSAASLVTAHIAALRDPRIGAAFLDQLALGGVDGTLRHRFRGKLAGKIRGKTGTLARAHSLTGLVLGDDGKPRLAFALLINGIAGKAEEQRRRIDRVVERAVTSR